jgi:uncharacterized membrane protein
MPLLTRAAYFDPSGVFGGIGLLQSSPTEIVFVLLSYLLGFLAVISLVLIVYAGFMIMTSSGNEERVQKGFATLRWTIIGLFLIMSSWGIVLMIDSALDAID